MTEKKSVESFCKEEIFYCVLGNCCSFEDLAKMLGEKSNLNIEILSNLPYESKIILESEKCRCLLYDLCQVYSHQKNVGKMASLLSYYISDKLNEKGINSTINGLNRENFLKTKELRS